MQKQQLSSPRETEYKCPNCGTITTISSLSMKPTASVQCVDCGTRVFEESQTDVQSKIDKLYEDRNSLVASTKLLDIDLSNLNVGNKAYRDLIVKQSELVRSLINIVSDRIVILENIIKGN